MSMNNPEILLIIILLSIIKLINVLDFVSENVASNNRGIEIPIPKNINDNIFCANDVIVTDFANNAAIIKGLHGITIAPKKKPYKNALM